MAIFRQLHGWRMGRGQFPLQFKLFQTLKVLLIWRSWLFAQSVEEFAGRFVRVSMNIVVDKVWGRINVAGNCGFPEEQQAGGFFGKKALSQEGNALFRQDS